MFRFYAVIFFLRFFFSFFFPLTTGMYLDKLFITTFTQMNHLKFEEDNIYEWKEGTFTHLS